MFGRASSVSPAPQICPPRETRAVQPNPGRLSVIPAQQDSCAASTAFGRLLPSTAGGPRTVQASHASWGSAARPVGTLNRKEGIVGNAYSSGGASLGGISSGGIGLDGFSLGGITRVNSTHESSGAALRSNIADLSARLGALLAAVRDVRIILLGDDTEGVDAAGRGPTTPSGLLHEMNRMVGDCHAAVGEIDREIAKIAGSLK